MKKNSFIIYKQNKFIKKINYFSMYFQKISLLLIALAFYSTFAFESAEPSQIFKNGMVAGTSGKIAIQEGLKILENGGNAIDAAITTALCQIVLSAGSWVSFAGIFSMIYYEASTNKIIDMNGNYNTVKEELDPLSIPKEDNKPTPKGRTVLVPGFIASIETAHKQFGKLPFEELFVPAINLAENGVEWSSLLNFLFEKRKEILSRRNETKEIFVKDDGSYYQIGDNFRQLKLADFLRKVSIQGSAYMYEGEWAVHFIDTVQSEGGKITLQDLKSYRPILGEPIKWESSLKNFTMYIHGIETRGGPDIIQALNLLEASTIPNLKLNYMESAEVLRDVISILNIVEMKYYNISEARKFGLDIINNIVDKNFSKMISNFVKEGLFDPNHLPVVNLGVAQPKHSDAIVVSDNEGNLLAITHSINTNIWGETGIFIEGVSIPDSASFQQYDILRAGPGNRLQDPLCPGFIFKGEKPILGFSSIGTGLFEQTFTSLLSFLYFGTNVQESIEIPYIGYLDYLNGKTRTLEPDKFQNNILEEVKNMGILIEENSSFRGYWDAISKDFETNELLGTVNKPLGDALGY